MTKKRFKISFDNNQNIYDVEEKCYFSSIDAKKLCNLLNALYNENEQLKQQIQQLQHWNKCLAEKRHQELSYRPYTASKSEKELKELLEQKLFNCSDNIKSDRYD